MTTEPTLPPVGALQAASGTLGIPVTSEAQHASSLQTLRAYGLSADDAQHLALGREPKVSPQMRAEAEAMKARLMRDPEWVGRYLSGDHAAAEAMMSINLRLCAKVEG